MYFHVQVIHDCTLILSLTWNYCVHRKQGQADINKCISMFLTLSASKHMTALRQCQA